MSGQNSSPPCWPNSTVAIRTSRRGPGRSIGPAASSRRPVFLCEVRQVWWDRSFRHVSSLFSRFSGPCTRSGLLTSRSLAYFIAVRWVFASVVNCEDRIEIAAMRASTQLTARQLASVCVRYQHELALLNTAGPRRRRLRLAAGCRASDVRPDRCGRGGTTGCSDWKLYFFCPGSR